MKLFFVVLVLFLALLPASAQETLGYGIMPRAGLFGTSSAAAFPKLRNKMAHIRSGDASAGNLRIYCTGDSTTLGYLSEAAINAYPNQLVEQLKKSGIPAIQSPTSFNQYNISTFSPLDDPRISVPVGWGAFGDYDPTANNIVTNSTAAPNGLNLSFTPGYAFDTIKIYWLKYGAINVNLNVDGGSTLATMSGGTDGSTQVTTVTVSNATHVINIVPANSGASNLFSLCAIEAYDSTKPCVEVMNAGGVGARIAGLVPFGANYATQLATPTHMVPGLWRPDVIITDMTINDTLGGTPIETYRAAYSAYVDGILATPGDFGTDPPDMLIATGNPPFNYARESLPYNLVNQEIAAKRGLGFLDVGAGWYSANAGVYPARFALYNGWYQSDGVHPTKAGYNDIANSFYNTLFAGVAR